MFRNICVSTLLVVLGGFGSVADTPESPPQVSDLLATAEDFRSAGMMRDAVSTLERARQMADAQPLEARDDNQHRLARIYDRLAVTYLGMGELVLAEQSLDAAYGHANAIAAENRREGMFATIRNDTGNLRFAAGELDRAVVAFDDAIRLGRGTTAPEVFAAARLGLVQGLVDFGWQDGIEERMAEAIRAVESTPVGPQKARHLLALGQTLRNAQQRFRLSAAWRKRAHDAYQAALGISKTSGDRSLTSYALGYLGRLYEDERRYDEALAYTRRASFLAQELSLAEGRWVWEWQTARLQRASGRTDDAIASYRRALETLESIKTDLASGPKGSYRKVVEPVFTDFADVMLARTATMSDPAKIREGLREVRAMLEQVKAAELQEYFELECAPTEAVAAELDSLTERAAVIYPILLEDRIELLVSLPERGLTQFTTKVSHADVVQEIDTFRRYLQIPGDSHDYLPHGQRLYSWLVEPLAGALAEAPVDTLVFVPDGPLRTIPMSALHDGDRFLVEGYSIATTPGLVLTNPRPMVRAEVEILAYAITESVQGFPALPHVDVELGAMGRAYPATVFKDDGFQAAGLETGMAESDFAIVHVATHGKFESDHRRSFILAHDEKLTLDRLREAVALRRHTDEPIELLVLSACETAAGDDRAALGLAGVALQAGARSALASLWSVNDESTASLVSQFYERLSDETNSKADALRAAQILLIEDERYRHPGYWAPFLLIGNWL